MPGLKVGDKATIKVHVQKEQRIREIGIMRSIGATPGDILGIIMAEGILTGLISWVFSVLLSIPLTVVIGNTFGMIFLRTPLDLIISYTGIGIWLFTVIAITAVASLIPAYNATRLPVHEILAYE